jgi:hypothetical protein
MDSIHICLATEMQILTESIFYLSTESHLTISTGVHHIIQRFIPSSQNVISQDLLFMANTNSPTYLLKTNETPHTKQNTAPRQKSILVSQ